MPSVWEYVAAQLRPAAPPCAHDRAARVAAFVRVPLRLEGLLLVGGLVCLDALLHVLAVLPARGVLAALAALWHAARMRPRRALRELCRAGDALQLGALAAAVWALHAGLDASQMYHAIRGQSAVKLYVIFNVFEVFDKLCASFGLDVLEAAAGGTGLLSALLLPVHLALHAALVLLQLVTLNVAVNSQSNALLTLLVSNQFVEVKSAVFKRFERDTLFQLACADVVERFQLALYILLLGARNASAAGPEAAPVLGGLLAPLGLIWASEVAVDWVKHAFICKFNAIAPEAYSRFVDALARDFFAGRPLEITGAGADDAAHGKDGTRASEAECAHGVRSRSTCKTPGGGPGTPVRKDAQRNGARQCGNQGTPNGNGQADASTRHAAASTTSLLSSSSSEGTAPNHSAAHARRRAHVPPDPAPAAARRIGFSALPLACVVLHVALQTARGMEMRRGDFWALAAGTYAALWALKVAVGLGLMRYMQARVRA